ncbi:cytidine deaminase [Oleiagrimonas sp. MCCC 1A03011]|uniref:cytidine deaminase n=1 Tax=Oleiagrimonas sp. MCCC 1A03011 TaxID=1926883 RepID=UPI000DDB73B2
MATRRSLAAVSRRAATVTVILASRTVLPHRTRCRDANTQRQDIADTLAGQDHFGGGKPMNPDQLMQQARQSRDRAYAPYSNFHVGAAVLTHDGQVFGGCNIENASYGLCNCAERTALFSAIAAGCKPGDFAHIAVISDTEAPVTPCGACRQVMAELAAADTPVTLANTKGQQRRTTVAALLPDAFRFDGGA